MPSKDAANIKMPIGQKMRELSQKWRDVVWDSPVLDFCGGCNRVFVSTAWNPQYCPFCESEDQLDYPRGER